MLSRKHYLYTQNKDMTSEVTYTGNLRTENTHQKSGAIYITDAPIDNNGKGEAFSPTDTVATGLANCILTVMGIKSQQMKPEMEGAKAEVIKTMASNPRRISKIEINITMPSGFSKKEQKILEHTAHTCPVHYSLHPDIEKDVTIHWE